MIDKIRNFCIIAHIDHGKSTLADRLLEYTGTVSRSQLRPQLLDEMDLERERGITIRSKTVRILYRTEDNNEYILNLIDTPGHVDFTYEVSRAAIASEGAVLVVDASQGVEAQTLANTLIARKNKLKIIPVINKIDLPTADVHSTKMQIKDMLNIYEQPIEVSAKEGLGINLVLQSIVDKIPSPTGDPQKSLKAIVFDSFYDPYRGVVVYLRIFDGRLTPGMKINFVSSGRSYEVLEVGTLCLKMFSKDKLEAGEVGYCVAGIKNIHDVKIGDTVIEKDKPTEQIECSWIEAKPFVFAGFFPINPKDFDELKTALEKLHLTDASLSYRVISSSALGPGFHCGFLGSLHLEIVKERIEREFGASLLVTSPNVNYRVKLKNDDKIIEIDNPSKFPPYHEIEFIEEPYVKATIITPNMYLSNVIELCKNNRGKVIEVRQIETIKSILSIELPLSEIIVGFYDSLKSVSKGYASFDYENIGYKKSDLVKLEVLINYELVDAFSYIVHRSRVERISNKLIEKLKTTIPRHLFQIPIQVKAENRIVARDDIKALRKDVLAKCYGGDVTRKRKLLEKQKDGKKKMRQFGKVEIPQETFMSLLKLE